jgi:hypothetical protein
VVLYRPLQIAFHTAYRALGGKAVLGRPLCSLWTSDGPALQAFDTMLLGAVPNAAGRRPSVRPVDLPLLLAKLDLGAVVAAGIPRPSAPPPTTTTGVRMLLTQPPITLAYLGVDPATATPADWRHAAERFGLVPERARRLEPVPGLPAPSPPTAVDTGPFLRLLTGGLGPLALAAAGAGAVGRAGASRPALPPGD